MAETIYWRSLASWRRQQKTTKYHYLRTGRPRRWEDELFYWAQRRFNTEWCEIARSCSRLQWNSLAKDFLNHLKDDYATRHPKADLNICTKCGNIHDLSRKCWQGPGGSDNQWFSFSLPSGAPSRAIHQSVQESYLDGQIVFRSDGAAPGQVSGGSPAAAWASAYFVVDGIDLVPVELSYEFVGPSTSVCVEALGVYSSVYKALSLSIDTETLITFECDCRVVVDCILGYADPGEASTFASYINNIRVHLHTLKLTHMVCVSWIPRRFNHYADNYARLAAKDEISSGWHSV